LIGPGRSGLKQADSLKQVGNQVKQVGGRLFVMVGKRRREEDQVFRTDRHSGFRRSGFGRSGLDVRGLDVRG